MASGTSGAVSSVHHPCPVLPNHSAYSFYPSLSSSPPHPSPVKVRRVSHLWKKNVTLESDIQITPPRHLLTTAVAWNSLLACCSDTHKLVVRMFYAKTSHAQGQILMKSSTTSRKQTFCLATIFRVTPGTFWTREWRRFNPGYTLEPGVKVAAQRCWLGRQTFSPG